MVAVIAGSGRGLFNTSLNTLGGGGVFGQGNFGQSGGQALVNASNGNLVIQFTDRQISGVGLDLMHTRTYNAQGAYNDADSDGWRWDGERRLVLSGTRNTVGSSVVRTTGDGHETTYAWNGSAYQSSDGDGAHDSVTWDSARGEWTWTDGSRRTVDRYDSVNGRLLQVSDASGTRINYSYDINGRLTSVQDSSGDELILVYNSAGQLERLDTRAYDGLRRQVYYSYDSLGRLATVTTDLTPQDNSITDGQVYSTRYSYDGSSLRIASISQSDGTAVSYTYQLLNGEYRIATVTDAAGTTRFSYDTTNRRTDVINALNQRWSYFYDADGRLTEVQTPVVDNGNRLSTRYAYDADGNVSQVIDELGNAITYSYDGNGNRILERDSMGNSVRRVYGTANQLLNEIRYSRPAIWENGTQTWSEPLPYRDEVQRYVYDGENRLRYLVSGEGVVSEYRYDYQGLVGFQIQYGSTFNAGQMAPLEALSETTMNAWAGGQDLTRTSQTELIYDYCGNLSYKIDYSNVSASGYGLYDVSTTITEYVYNQHSQLLQTVVSGAFSPYGSSLLSSYTYDGLGRVLTELDRRGVRTYSYNGNNRTVSVTNAAGLTITQGFDAQGRLLHVSESGAGVATRMTQYHYDAAGRLSMVEDATGVRSFTIYDEAGRVSAQVDGIGAVTEYTYHPTGQKSKEIRYSTLADTRNWYDGAVVTKKTADDIRPLSAPGFDRVTLFRYDAAGRLTKITNAGGYETDYFYNGRGQLTQVQQGDRSTYTYYDADARVLGGIDAEGTPYTNYYNGAGRLSSTVRRGSGTDVLAQYFFYDLQGRLIGTVDEKQFVTETVYDVSNNRQQTIRYATAYTGAIDADTSFDALRSVLALGAKQISTTQYDGFGRVSQRIGPDGTVTAYEYDSAGRLVREIQAQGTNDERSSRWRYDVLGQTLGHLTGEGAGRITAGMTEAQVQATYASYGLTYAYDAAGRQLSVTDAAGNTIVSYYDAAGRLTHTINKLGEVTETAYNAFGEAIQHTRFIDRLSTADVAGLGGGLLTTPLSPLTMALRNNVANNTRTDRYDLRGQLIQTSDALGYSTSYSYDAYGQQIGRTRIINWGAATRFTLDTWSYNKRGELLTHVQDANGAKRVTAFSYDAFGRVISRTDGRGLTSTTRYDNSGRVVVITNPRNESESTEYDAFARVLQQTDALGRVTRYSYDDATRSVTQTLPDGVQVITARNRHGETLSITDGNGNTTSYSYDKDGRLQSTQNALNQTTTQAYDAAGRTISVTDAAGNTTRYTYDAAGRTLTVTNALNSVTRYTYDGLGRKIRLTEAEGSAAQRVTDYSYDATGQLLQVIQDPMGLQLSTTYAYDGLGRQLQVSRGTVAAPQQQVTRYEFDNLGRRVAERVDPDGLNLQTRYQYNGNDQVTQKIQVLNAGTSYTTAYTYDNAGRLSSTTDAAGKIESYTYDAVGNRKTLTDKNGAIWNYNYDLRSRLSSTTDAAGKVENFTYDAVGNRKTLTNKNGAVWNYNYDSNNRLIEEISPQVWITTGLIGTQSIGSNYRLVTLFEYDAVGNVISRSEGRLRVAIGDAAISDDLTQARTTTYAYDALNRQIGITSPGYYNKLTGAYQQSSDGTPNTFRVTTEVTYDAAGNAVRNRVRVNNTGNVATDYIDSFKVYDGLGRVTHEVDALKGVTAYTYDSLGNQLTVKRYANGLSAPVPVSGYYRSSDIGASTLVADTARDRTLTSGYDKAGRKLWVQQDFVNIYTFTGSVAGSGAATLAPTTVYSYDALGRVVKETQIGRAADGSTQMTGASTVYYYDVAGHRIGIVNAQGYYTRFEHDALGHVIRQVEYSTALASWNEGALPTPPPSTLTDRSTLYSYDAMGRIIQTTRENVLYGVQDATSPTGQVYLSLIRGNLVQSKISYDNAGNIRTLTDALGNTTTTGYNALGQIVQVVEPARWTAQRSALNPFASGTAGLVLASPTILYGLNAFGQVVQERRSVGLDSQGRAQSGVIKISRTEYDAAGYEIKSFDATNAMESYKVDVAGRRIEESQQISMTLNAWTWVDGNKFKYEQTITRHFEYDKLGQQTSTISWYADWDGLTKQAKDSVEYNRFGEVTFKRMNGAALATYNYDQAGRVTSLADMQQWIVTVDYDLAGNASRRNQLGELFGSADDDRITYTRYDLLGRAVEQHLPVFTTSTGSDLLNNPTLTKNTPIIRQAFDRWGNVIQHTDARGGVTFYGYDHDNRLVDQTLPGTYNLRENGTISSRPTLSKRVYNAQGYQIAEQDYLWPYAGSTDFTLLRTRHHVYNQVGDLNRDVDALGYTRSYLTDAHGNRVATRDALGAVTVDRYDAMDRHISHGDLRYGYLTTILTNRYDQAGRLVAQINGATETEETLTSAREGNWGLGADSGVQGNTRYTLRDALGNIQWSMNESKILVRYGYDAYSRKTNEWDALGNSQNWTYSAGDYSRLVSHTDLAGRVFNYSYNFFGQLASETYFGPDQAGVAGPSAGGIRLDRLYAYYENGLLQSISDVETESPNSTANQVNRDISAYEYDIAGNRTRDVTWKFQQWVGYSPDPITLTSGVRDVRYQYDEQGRIKEIKMQAGTILVGSADYELNFSSSEHYTTTATGQVDYLAYDYDEFGNRRRIRMDTTNQSGARTVLDHWFKYDLEDRVLVADGFLSGGQVVAGQLNGEAKGYAMTYGATGLRTSQTRWSASVGGQEQYQRDTYTYNYAGQLLNQSLHHDFRLAGADYTGAVTSSQNKGWVLDNTYDTQGQGRLVLQSNYKNGAHDTFTRYRYRGDGKLTSQVLHQVVASGGATITQGTYFNEANMRDAMGNQIAYRYVVSNAYFGGSTYEGSYTTSYAAFGSYKELQTVATATVASRPGTSTYRYTERGELLQVETTGASYYTRMFASNREGQLITSYQTDGRTQSHIYVKGREVANIGTANTPQITDTVEAMAQGSGSLVPTRYVINRGDTLQSIAQQVWGDSAMWYLIADANGLVAGAELPIGDSLKIPNVQGSNRNEGNSFKPYNPNDVIGNTTPNVQLTPPKPKKKKSGGLTSIVMVVIAVVATIYTAGAAGAFFATAGSVTATTASTFAVGTGVLAGGSAATVGLTTTALIGSAVIGGAVGSAVAQLAGKALGVVDHFSWRQVAASGLTAGLTAGVGTVAQAGTLGNSAQTAAKSMLQPNYVGYSTYGTFNYASNQAINRVVGLDTSFSWRGMAASVLATNLGGYVGASNALKDQPGLARGLVTGQASALASAHLNDKWFGGGRPDYGQVAVDAFGNTLASFVRDQLGKTTSDIEIRNTMDAAGIEYRINENGDIETPSPFTKSAVEKILRSGASSAEIAELLNGTLRSTLLTQTEVLSDGRVAYHYESGSVSYSAAEEGLLVQPAASSAVIDAGSASPIVQLANTVLPPINDAQLALGAFASEHPTATRLLGYAAQGAMYAIAGPVAAVKDIVVSNTLGPYLERGQQYAEGMLSAFYQGKGVGADTAPIAATATFFAATLLAGQVSQGIGAAQHTYKQTVAGKNTRAFKDYNQARNAALGWLDGHGFKAERVTPGKFGINAGLPVGMRTADNKTGFRVEFDDRHGAHINVWSEKQPKETFTFEGSQNMVDQIVKQFRKER